MLPIFMDNFLAIAPSQLPRIINQEWMEKPLFYEEFTLLTFNLPKTYSVDDIMDMFDEQMQIIPLYHKVCSNATSFGHSCAAYSNPDFGAKDDSLSMWDFHNLLTESNKGSYIDTYLQRAVNATEVTVGINNALHGDEKYRWFIG